MTEYELARPGTVPTEELRVANVRLAGPLEVEDIRSKFALRTQTPDSAIYSHKSKQFTMEVNLPDEYMMNLSEASCIFVQDIEISVR